MTEANVTRLPAGHPPQVIDSDQATILTALHQVMGKVPYVQKTGKNAFHGYAYASEADLLASLRPAMLEAGLLLIPSVVSAAVTPVHTTKSGAQNYRADVTLEMTLAHKSGATWPPIAWRASGIDTEDKMIAKAITSGEKYFLLKLFMVETGVDPDADGGEQGKVKTKTAESATGNGAAPTTSGSSNSAASSAKKTSPVVDRLKAALATVANAKGPDGLRPWWEQHKEQIKGECVQRDGTFHAKLWMAVCMTVKAEFEAAGVLNEGERVE